MNLLRAIARNIRREPVRWFTVLSALTPLITTGFILFDWWHPTIEQLAYVNGFPAGIALAFGITVVRQAVTPNEKISDTMQGAIARADKGLGVIETIVLIVVVVLACYGAALLFGWI